MKLFISPFMSLNRYESMKVDIQKLLTDDFSGGHRLRRTY